MSGLCLVAGLMMAVLGDAVTLRWTHSIEKIAWEEDYRVESGQLRLVEARIRGTGAGMEPPAGAVLRNGVWHYVPAVPPLPRLALRHSPHVPAYTLCTTAGCRSLADWLPELPKEGVVELLACTDHPAQHR